MSWLWPGCGQPMHATNPVTMSPFLRILSPLRDAAVAFFRHDVALRREDNHVRIVLEERHPDSNRPRTLDRHQMARLKEDEELRQIREQLAALLDEQPDNRRTMRHLAFVEHALGKKGLRALHKVPLDVLQRALDQFEGMVSNWSAPGLANLRSKMAVAVIDREHQLPEEAEADAYRTAAVLESIPSKIQLPEVVDRSDDDALAAAYAALGHLAPGAVEIQAELGSPSARASAVPPPRHGDTEGEIRLREVQL